MNETTVTRTGTMMPLISVITFIGFLDTPLLIPIIALYASELGVGVGMVGVIIGLYSLVNTPANILFGRLVDRFGFRIPLVIGLAGDAVGMFLYSVCRLPFHLALVRSFHGFFGGIAGPATMTAMAQHGGETRQGRTMAVYGMTIAAATLVGYGMSGFIASWVSYDAVFWGGAGVLGFGAVLAIFLPGSSKERVAVETAPPGETRPRILELIRRKALISPYLTIFAQYFALGGLVTLLPLFVKEAGREALHVGILMAAFSLLFIIVQIPVGALSDRLGRKG
ncbi:MAG: MFS transporter, partial [Dehalococcoidales bacterium]|nr:MFS transporter [Dehalococcoidales bacterium]